MKEEGLVLEIEGETAKVEIKRTTTCKGCGICRVIYWYDKRMKREKRLRSKIIRIIT